jgi:hypothetical protein
MIASQDQPELASNMFPSLLLSNALVQNQDPLRSTSLSGHPNSSPFQPPIHLLTLSKYSRDQSNLRNKEISNNNTGPAEKLSRTHTKNTVHLIPSYKKKNGKEKEKKKRKKKH